jgi:hypothetical protein
LCLGAGNLNLHLDVQGVTGSNRHRSLEYLLGGEWYPIHRFSFRIHEPFVDRHIVTGALGLFVSCGGMGHAQSHTTVFVDADHRTAQSLNGDWHYVVDSYDGGLYSFHRALRKDGFFLGAPETGSNGMIEYDFRKSPTLKVPSDWNTQRDTPFYYED